MNELHFATLIGQLAAAIPVWRDMNSAPKDGTIVLLKWQRPDKDNPTQLGPVDVVVGRYAPAYGPGSEEWMGLNVSDYMGWRTFASLTNSMLPHVGPIAWMPLPPASEGE